MKSMLEKIKYEPSLPVKMQLLNIKDYPWHYHDDFQIVYVLEGEIELKLTYSYYVLKKNDIHVIHTDDVHGFRSLSESNMVVLVSFDMDYFIDIFSDLGSQVFTTKISRDPAKYRGRILLKTRIFSMLSEVDRRSEYYRENLTSEGTDIIRILYAHFRSFTLSREKREFEYKNSHDEFQSDRISRVVSFIYENYPYKLSLTDIARDENIDKYYLSHLFQKFVGESFRNFVSMVRVEYSEARLLETDMSISQIASDVGFSNAKYYVDNFEYWFGCSPKEYRGKFAGSTVAGKGGHVDVIPPSQIGKIIDLSIDRDNDGRAEKFAVDILSVQIDFCCNAETQILPLEHSRITVDSDAYRRNEKIRRALLELVTAAGDGIAATDFTHPSGISAICKAEVGSFYYDTYPHSYCMDVLKRVVNGGGELLLQLNFSDSEENKDGMLLVNGLKKPLYYLCVFLHELRGQLIALGDAYIVSRREDNLFVLLFNENNNMRKTFNLRLINVPDSMQLTVSTLCASDAAINYWCRLNFKDELSNEDFCAIEKMSSPAVSFEVIPKSSSHIYRTTLEPQGIVLIKIK